MIEKLNKMTNEELAKKLKMANSGCEFCIYATLDSCGDLDCEVGVLQWLNQE